MKPTSASPEKKSLFKESNHLAVLELRQGGWGCGVVEEVGDNFFSY